MGLFLGVLGGLLLLFTLTVLSLASKLRRRDTFLRQVHELLRKLGARPVDDAWEFEGRRYRLRVEPPTMFEGSLFVSIGLYTPYVDEFMIRHARGIAVEINPRLRADPLYRDYVPDGELRPELEEWLLRPETRAILQKALHGRWRTFGKRAVELYFADNVFHHEALDQTELLLALRALRLLDTPVSFRPHGGLLTIRFGFEPDVPPWHWQPEQIRTLPPGLTRAAVSAYYKNPYLNAPLVDLLYALAGDRHTAFLFPRCDLAFLEHALGKTFEYRDALFVTRDSVAPVAADLYLDGGFFHGFLAFSDPPGEIAEEFRDIGRARFHEIAVELLPRLHLYVRRLFDDEASWYSGEYEILSTRLSDQHVLSAVESVASKYGARVVRLDRRFNIKLFRDERFEFSP